MISDERFQVPTGLNSIGFRWRRQVLSFNAMLNLYTLEKQEFTFEIDGRMIHRFQHESFSADPYLSLVQMGGVF